MLVEALSLSYFFISLFFFFKQKTAYEMRISDWSSDVCSSDLTAARTSRAFGPATFITAQPVVTFSTKTFRSVHSHCSHSLKMSVIAATWPLVDRKSVV